MITGFKDYYWFNNLMLVSGSGGGDRDVLPGPNSFIFMQFSAKNGKITPTWELGPPPEENPLSATVTVLTWHVPVRVHCLWKKSNVAWISLSLSLI